MPVCPFCYSNVMRKYGFYRYRRPRRQKWRCEACGAVTAYPLARRPRRRAQRLRG